MRTVIFTLTLITLVLRVGGLQAKPPAPSIDQETVRKAILIFRQTPLNQQGSMVRPLILRFARESPAVEIIVSSKAMPWIENSKVGDEAKEALLTAYIAGDVQAQLGNRKTRDDPVAGTEQVIATYRQLRKAEPHLKIAEVEKLIDLQRRGKLAKHFETASR